MNGLVIAIVIAVLAALACLSLSLVLLAGRAALRSRLGNQSRELRVFHALSGLGLNQESARLNEHISRVIESALDAQARLILFEKSKSSPAGQLGDDHKVLSAGGRQSRVTVGVPDEGIQPTTLVVSLKTSQRDIGVLTLTRNASRPFSQADRELARTFGAQASLLLEERLLYEEVAAGVVLQERSRLAREIHDGLAQHLAFLKMRVAWLQRSHKRLEPSQLADVESVAETALVEARHAISMLRTDTELTTAVEGIEAYAEEFANVSRLPVDLTKELGAPEVGPLARVELLRIVQECLNNVRKHARANRVALNLANRKGGLEVQVTDDGIGFGPGQSSQRHFGVDIMQERAASVGGTVEIESRVGKGTKVRVWIPGQDQEIATSISDAERPSNGLSLPR